MVLSIEVEGLKDALKVLDKDNMAVLAAANNAIHEAGFHVLAEVKASVAGQRSEPLSVDTGRFLNSVTADNSELLVSKVSSEVEYAEFLEYGTSRGLLPRRHFGNTVKREKDRVAEFVREEVGNA